MSRRWAACSLVALLCAFVGCGGQSEGEGDDSPSGGESGNGGNGGSAGANGGTTGANGGSGGDICSLPPESGPCEAAIRRYAFDPKTGLCLPFVYGGCQGNANNFENPEACYGACGGQGELEPTTCERPADCLLVPTTCCGACDPPTSWNVVAVGNGHASAVERAMGCDLGDCPPCDPPLPNPWLFPRCSAGRCIAADAQEMVFTACTQPSECRLRQGLGCCEGCNADPDATVSVNAAVDLTPWLCGAAPDECDACVPPEPMYLDPTCDRGRCGVLRASPPID